MPRGTWALTVPLVLLALLVPAGMVGTLGAPEGSPGQGEALEPLLAPAPVQQPDPGPVLDRVDVEPRQDPLEVGGTVAIRAVVDPGPLQGPVRLEVTVEHADGTTHLSPSPVHADPHRPTLVATYWDAQAPGAFRVQGTVTVADTVVLELPPGEGHVEATSEQAGSPDGWVKHIVEGSILWGLVLASLGLASRWARRIDGDEEEGG